MMDLPLVVFAVSLIVLWLAAEAGSWWSRRTRLDADDQADLGVIVAAALTLLGLIIGFTFSMAVSRYNQRKDYEAAEGNAIGTEHVRAGLLPSANAAKVRELPKAYVDQRILFYNTGDAGRLQQLRSSESKLQNDLWSAVEACAATDRSNVMALAVSGMNDVLNFAGVHAGRLVESHTDCGVGFNGGNRRLLQLPGRLHGAAWRKKSGDFSCCRRSLQSRFC